MIHRRSNFPKNKNLYFQFNSNLVIISGAQHLILVVKKKNEIYQYPMFIERVLGTALYFIRPNTFVKV